LSIGKYCAKAALERRGASGEDLPSMLGNAHINGRLLTDRELAHNGLLYVGAGLETTRNAISAGLLEVLRYRLLQSPVSTLAKSETTI
jgi:cytochrome P450